MRFLRVIEDRSQIRLALALLVECLTHSETRLPVIWLNIENALALVNHCIVLVQLLSAERDVQATRYFHLLSFSRQL
jgi:hypothetical protein